jgi:Nif-specific regulatory protein
VDKEIGRLLVDQGLLTQAELDEFLRAQAAGGGRLTEVLLANGRVTPEELVYCLSLQVDLSLLQEMLGSHLDPSGLARATRDGLRRRIDRLSLLLKSCAVVSAQRDAEYLLELIAREAAVLLDADRSTLFLLDESRGQLWSRIALGLEDRKEIRFDAALGIAGHVARTGQVVRATDAQADPRFNPDIDRITGYKTTSLLCVPVRNAEGKLIGAFQAVNKRAGQFTAEDTELLTSLAGQAAIALENTQILDQLRRMNEVLEQENAQLRRVVAERVAPGAMIGASPVFQAVVRLAMQVADSPVGVLLTGESGTGKELLARAIHQWSPRAKGPFLAINCAALPEALLESELFGIEKGVATGVSARAGKIELASGGTAFLDEVGDMSLAMQAKMLRVLQERELVRVGGARATQVDIRVIAATNKDLHREIRESRFREDLYYRLNVVAIHVPALRERVEDIPLLAQHFLDKAAAQVGRPPRRLTAAGLEALKGYAWPGNIRELENEIARAVALARDQEALGAEAFSERVRGGAPAGPPTPEAPPAQPAAPAAPAAPQSLADRVKEVEVALIRDALSRTAGNRAQAARLLGLSREGLRKKMRRFGLEGADGDE